MAPTIAGIVASDGSTIAAHHALVAGPSVLFDAVAILPSSDGASLLAQMPAARDFVADAFAHCKFIAHVKAASMLFTNAGVPVSSHAGTRPAPHRRQPR